MRKIFIDIGAYDGVSAKFIREVHPQGKEFEIYSFECDQRNISTLKSLKHLNINLIEKAAWIYSGTVKYYYGKDDGGSMYSTKKTGNINPEKFYGVPCIDIAEFIKSNFNKGDYIIMKMNCEGAEYNIIPHLLNNNLIDWIDKWYVQWHYHKIGMSKEEHDKTLSIIPNCHDWECQSDWNGFIPKFKKSL